MFDFLLRHRKILLLAILVGFAYVLFSNNLVHRKPLRWYDRTVLVMVSPFQRLATGIVDGVVDFWTRYVFLVGTDRENLRLKRKVINLQVKNDELIEAALENERLRKLLYFRDRFNAPKISAEVVAVDLSSQFEMVRIDRGATDGIQVGMPVLGDGGVVGQVFRIAGETSDVLLATDRNSNIDAVVQRSRARGIITGAGRKTFKMGFKYIYRNDDITAGDLVVTSGLDGVFPEGLSLGFITKVDRPERGIFQDAEIQPSVEFSKIKEVIVMLQQKRPDIVAPSDIPKAKNG